MPKAISADRVSIDLVVIGSLQGHERVTKRSQLETLRVQVVSGLDAGAWQPHMLVAAVQTLPHAPQRQALACLRLLRGAVCHLLQLPPEQRLQLGRTCWAALLATGAVQQHQGPHNAGGLSAATGDAVSAAVVDGAADDAQRAPEVSQAPEGNNGSAAESESQLLAAEEAAGVADTAAVLRAVVRAASDWSHGVPLHQKDLIATHNLEVCQNCSS